MAALYTRFSTHTLARLKSQRTIRPFLRPYNYVDSRMPKRDTMSNSIAYAPPPPHTRNIRGLSFNLHVSPSRERAIFCCRLLPCDWTASSQRPKFRQNTLVRCAERACTAYVRWGRSGGDGRYADRYPKTIRVEAAAAISNRISAYGAAYRVCIAPKGWTGTAVLDAMLEECEGSRDGGDEGCE